MVVTTDKEPVMVHISSLGSCTSFSCAHPMVNTSFTNKLDNNGSLKAARERGMNKLSVFHELSSYFMTRSASTVLTKIASICKMINSMTLPFLGEECPTFP